MRVLLSRFEYKFVLNLADYHRMKRQIQLLAKPDAHARLGGRYPVFTRYFDSPRYDYYFQKIDGEFHHIKVRLRSYDTKLNFPRSHLEAKIKYRDEQIKVKVPYGQDGTPEMKFIDQITADLDLSASCHIYYEREAYQFTHQGRLLRLNFDHLISALWPHEFQMSSDLLNSRTFSDGGSVLMEVKLPTPEWPELLRKMLSELSVKKLSFSKYAWGIGFLNQLKGDEYGMG